MPKCPEFKSEIFKVPTILAQSISVRASNESTVLNLLYDVKNKAS